LFIPAGYLFGNQEYVQKNFHLVIFAIIGLSLLPAVIEILREWRSSRRVQPDVPNGA
jgi:membrane-associated protein